MLNLNLLLGVEQAGPAGRPRDPGPRQVTGGRRARSLSDQKNGAAPGGHLVSLQLWPRSPRVSQRLATLMSLQSCDSV